MKVFITLTKRKPKWSLCFLMLLIQLCVVAQQETSTVTGTVTGGNGELLSGVTIKATGVNSRESYTTVTDEKGTFVLRNLKAGNPYTFAASYVGYEASTVNTSVKQGNNSIVISLLPSVNALNEVVIIGYGTQKRETVTGSISTIRARDFNAGQITDPMTLIAGKVAGLTITRPNGSDPNATADFSLR